MAANSEEVDLMGIGKHCSYCKRLDLLPFTCTKCEQIFWLVFDHVLIKLCILSVNVIWRRLLVFIVVIVKNT